MGTATAPGAIAPSPTLDFYKGAFECMDFFMSFWQPALKGIGRTQLQLAQVAAQNAQSVVRWTAELSASRTLSDVVTANIKCCDAIFEQQKDSLEKLTSAMARVVELPPALDVAAPPAVRPRDVLEIAGATESVVCATAEVPSMRRPRGPIPGAALGGKRKRKKRKTGAVRPPSAAAWGH